jgi:hypothetical protein
VRQAHGGIGASSHMACLLFTAEIGTKPTLVAIAVRSGVE